MAKFAIEAKGLKEVLKGLDDMEKNVLEELDNELSASSYTIVREAKRRVPKDTGALANSISASKNADFDHGIVANKEYAPFVEFGTGGLVNVPAGLENYAMQFKGKGIKQVNLPPRPFLYPAYEEERKKLIDRLKKIIPKATRGITVIHPGKSNITSVTTI